MNITITFYHCEDFTKEVKIESPVKSSFRSSETAYECVLRDAFRVDGNLRTLCIPSRVARCIFRYMSNGYILDRRETCFYD